MLGGDRPRAVEPGRGHAVPRVAGVGVRWLRQGGGMPSIRLARLLGRSLWFAEREQAVILRAQGAGVGQIPGRLGSDPGRSGGSWAVTPRPGAAVWTIAPGRPRACRSRGQAPEVGQARREPRAGGGCVQGRLAGTVTARGGIPCPVPRWAGSVAVTGAVRTGAGPTRGARSRSPTGCGSTSPMMRPCGSPTRPSTRPWRPRAGSAAPRADRLPGHRASPASARARTRGPGSRSSAPDHAQRASCCGSGPGRCWALGAI
jgi:hypothetical protein